ncbi:MAG: cytochrome c biogenesis protein CcdA [Tateyamaria sp.]|nr:cytochrome c biogenesis protein CcdA [Tateyamaria sp.]
MFGIDIIDASLIPAMGIALIAGIISFLSPCVLPIVPPYLAYLSGMTVGELSDSRSARNRATVAALFFVLGLSTVFIFLGFAASAFGSFFLQNQILFSQVSGAVIIVFGLHFLGVFRIGLLDREVRIDAGDKGGSSFGAYVLGLAFAFGWTPCIGPQLGAILTLAASEASVTRGTFLLAVYAFGLGIPFLLAAMFMSRALTVMNRLKRHLGLIEKLMGGLLVVVGAAMLLGLFTRFSFWLLERFPSLATLG